MGLLNRFQSMFQSDRVDLKERYEIVRKAVSGTMSKFYAAKDRRTGEIVGLKIGDHEKVTYFEGRFKGLKKPSEGEIAISLSHPNVVKTLEHGISTENVPFIVMEFVDGPGMHMMVFNRDKELITLRLKLIREMAEALAYVHKSGYIHRDVCPRNFIFSTAEQSAKLIDFGLTLPAKRDFMQPGNRTGTPLYMAPEIVRRRWTDQRVDIFALGVSAYQICAFELPWPTTEITGRAALQHDTDAPKELTVACPGIDPVLAKGIMKCIQAQPSDRPESVDQFLSIIRDAKP